MKNIRLTNDRLEDDASTDFSDISEDEYQTGVTIRSLRTAQADDWLSDEKSDEVIYKVKKVINGKTAIDKKEKADAFGKLRSRDLSHNNVYCSIRRSEICRKAPRW